MNNTKRRGGKWKTKTLEFGHYPFPSEFDIHPLITCQKEKGKKNIYFHIESEEPRIIFFTRRIKLKLKQVKVERMKPKLTYIF